MDKLQMAKALLVTEENAYTKGGQTVTAYGIAVSDSVDGLVRINLGGDTVSPEDDQAIEVETTFSVKEGDEVIVSLIGADGTGKTPIVIGVIGRGDEQQTEINTATTNAAEALEAAEDAQEAAENAIISQTNYYILSATVPATPTESSHSGWSTTEPAWAANSSDSLYLSVRTVIGSGTITWSAPALVQAYANINVARNAIISNVSETYVAQGDSNIATLSSTMKQDTSGVNIYNDISTVGDTYAHIDGSKFEIRQVGTANEISENDSALASFGREVTVGSRESSGTIGMYSQVFGQKCTASAPCSRASGFNTIAASAYQSVSGRNNVEDNTGTYAEIVGNGEYPNETEEFTTDGETISFTLQHEPTVINNFSVGGGINLASDVSSAQMNYTSDSQFTTMYYDVTFSKSFDYDVPLKITINGTLSYYSPPNATTQTHESKTVNFNGVLPANSSTLRVEFWKQLNSQFRLVGYQLGTQTFHSVNVVYTDGYTVNGTTLTLTNEASYWAQTFSGLTVAIDYTYEGTVTRSNARTLDWSGNEKLAGEIDASIRTETVAGYSGALHLYRFGRVVFLSTDDFKPKSGSVTPDTVLTQVIPVGFRPISVAVAPRLVASSSNNNFLVIKSDGSMTYRGGGNWANATTWSGTWITGDN